MYVLGRGSEAYVVDTGRILHGDRKGVALRAAQTLIIALEIERGLFN